MGGHLRSMAINPGLTLYDNQLVINPINFGNTK